jgi:hypothetical protein
MSTQDAETARYMECPCCGCEGAEADEHGEFYDGQPLICGCNGHVSVDPDGMHISIGDDPCPAGASCQP